MGSNDHTVELKDGEQPHAKESPATVVIDYTNWRGVRSYRKITPIRIRFGVSPWHKEPQWLLTAFDFDKRQEREFAMKKIYSWTGVGDP
jgi:hypothetical protein